MKKENWLSPVSKEDVSAFAFKHMNLERIMVLEEAEDINYGKFFRVGGFTNEPIITGWGRANNYMNLDAPYEGETEVLHFLEVLRDKIGFDVLKEKVTNPLTGKKIGAYYGCLLLRPGKIMGFDNPENPKILEDFIRAIGAEPVIYPYRNECCGGYISLKEKEMAENMCDKIMESADGFGAEMLITACPLCLYNLNNSKANKLPVVYFTELLAEALGVKEAADNE